MLFMGIQNGPGPRVLGPPHCGALLWLETAENEVFKLGMRLKFDELNFGTP